MYVVSWALRGFQLFTEIHAHSFLYTGHWLIAAAFGAVMLKGLIPIVLSSISDLILVTKKS